MTFPAIDPLEAKHNLANEAALNSVKREIRNILNSYVGWFDPFAELIQNSLDAIDERRELNDGFSPYLRIEIDIQKNYLRVTDNGIGLSEEKFKQFLAPSFSFKSGRTRGHKGVGATFLAYGFNSVRIGTKHPDFNAVGRMNDARKWLHDDNPAGNPKIFPAKRSKDDAALEDVDRGVSITLTFDNSTKPGDLRWIQAKDAQAWSKILQVKTGLGGIHYDRPVQCDVIVRDAEGVETSNTLEMPVYFWPHQIVIKSMRFRELKKKEKEIV